MGPIENHAGGAASRLDRLPVGAFHRRFIALVSVGNWFDVFDIFMMAYLGAALQSSHFLSLGQFTGLIAAGFLGMFAGTVIFGIGSDTFGRRTSFVAMLILYSLATLAGAFAPGPRWLVVFRFIAGVGIGAELVVIDTYVSEMVPRQVRGRYVAITQLIGFTSIPAVALLARLLVPLYWVLPGWRWVMIIGGAGALAAGFLRRRLVESPRWLEACGRRAEADKILDEIEDRIVEETGRPLPAPSPAAVEPVHRMPLAQLFGPSYRGRTLMLVVFQLLQTVAFYGFANWAPTFLLKEGHHLDRTLQYGFLIALVSPIGPLLAVLTSDRLERKYTIVALALAVALAGLGFARAVQASDIVAAGALLTVFTYWFSAVFHAYQAELFPTRARATGVGFTYSWSRLSAVFSTFIIGALLGRGVWAVFVFMAAAMGGVAMVIGFWGPRTNARTLEEISK